MRARDRHDLHPHQTSMRLQSKAAINQTSEVLVMMDKMCRPWRRNKFWIEGDDAYPEFGAGDSLAAIRTFGSSEEQSTYIAHLGLCNL